MGPVHPCLNRRQQWHDESGVTHTLRIDRNVFALDSEEQVAEKRVRPPVLEVVLRQEGALQQEIDQSGEEDSQL